MLKITPSYGTNEQYSVWFHFVCKCSKVVTFVTRNFCNVSHRCIFHQPVCVHCSEEAILFDVNVSEGDAGAV